MQITEAAAERMKTAVAEIDEKRNAFGSPCRRRVLIW